jgi:hypothetical protein
MLRNLILGLAAADSLTAAAPTPALADISYCMKHPNPNTCHMAVQLRLRRPAHTRKTMHSR